MSLLLDDMRKEFAAFLAADPAARFRMDAALAHVITLAYQAGLEDGKVAGRAPWPDARAAMDAIAAIQPGTVHG